MLLSEVLSLPNVLTLIKANPIFGIRPDYSLFTWIAKNNGVEYDEMIEGFLASALQRRERTASSLARL